MIVIGLLYLETKVKVVEVKSVNDSSLTVRLLTYQLFVNMEFFMIRRHYTALKIKRSRSVQQHVLCV